MGRWFESISAHRHFKIPPVRWLALVLGAPPRFIPISRVKLNRLRACPDGRSKVACRRQEIHPSLPVCSRKPLNMRFAAREAMDGPHKRRTPGGVWLRRACHELKPSGVQSSGATVCRSRAGVPIQSVPALAQGCGGSRRLGPLQHRGGGSAPGGEHAESGHGPRLCAAMAPFS